MYKNFVAIMWQICHDKEVLLSKNHKRKMQPQKYHKEYALPQKLEKSKIYFLAQEPHNLHIVVCCWAMVMSVTNILSLP